MSRKPPTPKRPPKNASPAALRDAIRKEALRLGFDAVGFAPADLAPEARRRRLEELGSFVAQGFQGDMGWLGHRTDERVDPATLWPEARTVVSLALNYAPPSDPLAVLGERERAAISVYAQGRDYHDVMKTRLKALGRFIWDTYRHHIKVFVDTAPLMEKPAAEAAGLGWQGRSQGPRPDGAAEVLPDHYDPLTPVTRLIRLSFGAFQLGNLARGEVAEVAKKVLTEQLGSTGPAYADRRR